MKTSILLLSSLALSLHAAPDPGFVPLLEGSQTSAWKQCGPGGIKIQGGIATTWTPQAKGVFYGVAWYSGREFGDFVLKAEFRGTQSDYNSGLRLRFPRPGNDPKFITDQGYEISIISPTAHAGDANMETGAIAHIQAPTAQPRLNGVNEWNEMEITVTGQKYVVKINGAVVNQFVGDKAARGYVGIENHKFGSVQWRGVSIKELAPPLAPVMAAPSSPAPAPVSIKDALVNYKWSWTHQNVGNASQVPKEVQFFENGEVKTTLGETWQWGLEGTHEVRIKFTPGTEGIVLRSDAKWEVFKFTAKQTVTAVRLVPLNAAAPGAPAASVETTAAQARIEVLKEQGPNAVEWALAPLDEAIPSDIRQNLTHLREDLLDEAKKNPKGSASAYQIGSEYCDKILAALDLRDLARVNAGYSAAQADADKKISNQALDARRNFQMSWPQYRREESQRSALRQQQENVADLKKERSKVDWTNRVLKMRDHLDDLYGRLREALRQPAK